MCKVLKPSGKFYIFDCSTIDNSEAEKEINRVALLRDNSHQFSYSPRLWEKLLNNLLLQVNYTFLHKRKYDLPQWFDRMKTSQDN